MDAPLKMPNGDEKTWRIDNPLRVWILENVAPGDRTAEITLLDAVGWELSRLLRGQSPNG